VRKFQRRRWMLCWV